MGSPTNRPVRRGKCSKKRSPKRSPKKNTAEAEDGILPLALMILPFLSGLVFATEATVVGILSVFTPDTVRHLFGVVARRGWETPAAMLMWRLFGLTLGCFGLMVGSVAVASRRTVTLKIIGTTSLVSAMVLLDTGVSHRLSQRRASLGNILATDGARGAVLLVALLNLLLMAATLTAWLLYEPPRPALGGADSRGKLSTGEKVKAAGCSFVSIALGAVLLPKPSHTVLMNVLFSHRASDWGTAEARVIALWIGVLLVSMGLSGAVLVHGKHVTATKRFTRMSFEIFVSAAMIAMQFGGHARLYSKYIA